MTRSSFLHGTRSTLVIEGAMCVEQSMTAQSKKDAFADGAGDASNIRIPRSISWA